MSDVEEKPISRFNVISTKLKGYESDTYLSKGGYLEFSISENRKEIDLSINSQRKSDTVNMCPDDIRQIKTIIDEIIEMIDIVQMEEIL